MKKKGTKQKSKTKGSENAFGCDLTEHLQNSGQDVPQVLQKCAEFIEKHGIVHGIYRLSGVTSNIQRLRQEFSSEACPDLTKEVYLQDIHCVGSLCKLYFRELPNPLLTYELYSKFTEVASVCGDHERLAHIQKTVKELPTPHFRTLEYLSKHLARLATLSAQTNMHTRNLALVWAPNLLRSKTIEATSGNGDMAFQEVRIQQSVVEFILNHTEQIFNTDSVQIKPKEGPSLICGEKYATLPISGQSGPMKLMSLEEAQARSLSPNHPLHKERQRENSLPDTSMATLYHTVIDLDSKRKLSGKSKKWRSIFNLGRSVDSKGKLSRNGSVFIRAPGLTEKSSLRPSRSMESLCSLPTDDDRTGNSPSGGQGSIFVPDVKSRTLGSDSLYDLSEHEQNWEFKGKKSGSVTGGWNSGLSQKGSLSGASATPQRTLPEQLKVFKGDDLSGNKPTSPKNRRMLYSGSSYNSSSRPSFPGSFFPLESSPRHQRRAVNISEPFAVSVPLRVSAVISSNSTPCRGLAKDRMAAAALKPCKETSDQSGGGKSNMCPVVEPSNRDGTEKKQTERVSNAMPKGKTRELFQEEMSKTQLEALSIVSEGTAKIPFTGQQLENQSKPAQQDKELCITKELWYDVHQELKITEPEMDLLDKTYDAILPGQNKKLTMDVKSKRSRSSPSLSMFCKDQSSKSYLYDHLNTSRSESTVKQPSESDIVFSLLKNDLWVNEGIKIVNPVLEETDKKFSSLNKAHTIEPQVSFTSDSQILRGSLAAIDSQGEAEEHESPEETQNISCDVEKIPEVVSQFSICLEERPNSLDLPIQEDDEGLAGNSEELDLVESWEDLSSSKQWVTSPLHSPDVEELFKQQLPFSSQSVTLNSDEDRTSFSSHSVKQSKRLSLAKTSSGNISQTSSSKYETDLASLPSTNASLNTSNGTQAPIGKCGTKKLKSSQHFYRQMSYESAGPEKRDEHNLSKHRPCSLNLDLGPRCIRDISNQQSRPSLKLSSYTRSLSETVNSGLLSELDLFLNDSQAPLRRNSAPLSVASVRTAFMIKTCKAKAVPVVPPKVQYSQIPHSRQDSDIETEKEQDTACPKNSTEKSHEAPPPAISDLKDELENKEPVAKQQNHPKVQKQAENVTTTTTVPPVITRRHTPSLEVFVDRPNRANILQRSSFRNRQRPQSLILFSPPFPIMDYPPPGDDGKLLSIKSMNEESAMKETSVDGVALQNKMTIPKSGQRLETSTSCFYQPQRRSMIFESRNHRQIE
ncbi:rho GTPase-activating protein 31 isoform X1 [Corythoichthys intestinalis]|uniref:rho GTPase-activating protein 31 isoform X1 n=1 Tax=Corythoichthys intestinalis TaxID=161448 RepID=UPI0025A68853|nr:rho GTPase-activating protein 31 isoform X1 [Corythoichthys intestinalis]